MKLKLPFQTSKLPKVPTKTPGGVAAKAFDVSLDMQNSVDCEFPMGVVTTHINHANDTFRPHYEFELLFD